MALSRNAFDPSNKSRLGFGQFQRRYIRKSQPLSEAVDALATAADARIKIIERYRDAKKIVNRHHDWDEALADAKNFEATVKALRAHVPAP